MAAVMLAWPLIGPGGAVAQDQQEGMVGVKATLPVEQHVVTAHNTETGYRVELFPANGNSTVQPRQSGTAIEFPAQLPANLCGNSVGITFSAGDDCAISPAQDGPDDNLIAEVTLPVDQHVVTAHSTETGYMIELFPDNGNSTVQPLQSPDIISGNVVQVPVEVPVNVCGNTINVVGLLNPATGNTCINK